MASIPNQRLVLNDWTSLNVITSTTVGTQLTIQNEGLRWFQLYESATKPDTNAQGDSVTNLFGNIPAKMIDSGSLEVWIRPTHYGDTIIFSVQEG